MRYEIEAIWSGYEPGQEKVVHREYTMHKSFVDQVMALEKITFADGTTLTFKFRGLEYGERKKRDIQGYKGLIRDCIAQGVNKVSELRKEGK